MSGGPWVAVRTWDGVALYKGADGKAAWTSDVDVLLAAGGGFVMRWSAQGMVSVLLGVSAKPLKDFPIPGVFVGEDERERHQVMRLDDAVRAYGLTRGNA